MVAMMDLGVADQKKWRKGPWTPEEDKLLKEYVNLHGEGRWSCVARSAGLNRNGKSCRLRWVNYLRSGLKRGQLTPQEEAIIMELHALWGNKWSTIARYLPGRTDNDIKNYWRTHFNRRDKSPHQKGKKSQTPKQKQQQSQEKVEDINPDYDQETKSANTSSDHDLNSEEAAAPEKQENVIFMYPNVMEQQLYGLPVISQDIESWVNSVVEDYDLWGGLWNLDGVPPPPAPVHVDHTSNKIAIQNRGANMCSGQHFF